MVGKGSHITIFLANEHKTYVEIYNLIKNGMQLVASKLDLLSKRADGIINAPETNKKVKNIIKNLESTELYKMTKFRV